VEAPGRYAPLTSDQQVFNVMMREPGKWPGIAVVTGRVTEAFEPDPTALGRRVKVAILPIALFTNGHSHFVQRHSEAAKVEQ
jgi:hypothetical protein